MATRTIISSHTADHGPQKRENDLRLGAARRGPARLGVEGQGYHTGRSRPEDFREGHGQAWLGTARRGKATNTPG